MDADIGIQITTQQILFDVRASHLTQYILCGQHTTIRLYSYNNSILSFKAAFT